MLSKIQRDILSESNRSESFLFVLCENKKEELKLIIDEVEKLKDTPQGNSKRSPLLSQDAKIDANLLIDLKGDHTKQSISQRVIERCLEYQNHLGGDLVSGGQIIIEIITLKELANRGVNDELGMEARKNLRNIESSQEYKKFIAVTEVLLNKLIADCNENSKHSPKGSIAVRDKELISSILVLLKDYTKSGTDNELRFIAAKSLSSIEQSTAYRSFNGDSKDNINEPSKRKGLIAIIKDKISGDKKSQRKAALVRQLNELEKHHTPVTKTSTDSSPVQEEASTASPSNPNNRSTKV